jgi:hypothetical protein
MVLEGSVSRNVSHDGLPLVYRWGANWGQKKTPTAGGTDGVIGRVVSVVDTLCMYPRRAYNPIVPTGKQSVKSFRKFFFVVDKLNS